jgi:hypothetical protein
MTLDEVMKMDLSQFKEACEDAAVDYSHYKPINTDTETLNDALEEFALFKSTDESIKAIHEAGRMIP